MKQIDFHLDFISPYAYLAFAKLPEALAGIDCHVRYKPVLFAALLKHHGQLGPAEIAARKRSIDTAIDDGGVARGKGETYRRQPAKHQGRRASKSSAVWAVGSLLKRLTR
jgi:2-hydroxychromene-2-carboxylate isomerase